ncbi:MAG TPA: hypothetical protein VG839_01755 [Asticcacaulis sp.]|nr:hypothetical protein [Asticcacaulis sp.]
MNAVIRWIGRQAWGPFIVGIAITIGTAVSAWAAFQHHSFWPEWFKLFWVILFIGAGVLPNRWALLAQFVILVLLCWAILDGKPLTLATLTGLSWEEKFYLGLCLVSGLLNLLMLFKRPPQVSPSQPAAN